MLLRTRIMPLLSVAALFSAFSSAPARAQDASSAKIGTVNTAQIFNQIHEKKDLEAKFKDQFNSYNQQDQTKKQSVGQIQEARNQFKPETQQWQDKNTELSHAIIEFKTWEGVNQAELQNGIKQLTATMYQKIEAAVGEVAKQRGFDIIIADQRGDLGNIEAITSEVLEIKLKQRIILYANPKFDLTNDVIAYMDKNYTSPAPAPAPAAAGDATPSK